MKQLLHIFFLVAITNFICSAQEVVAKEQYATSEVFSVVEEMPEFIGGSDEMFNFISKNLKFPTCSKDQNGCQKCYLNFIVNKNGEVKNIKVIRGIKDCPECDKEAIRVLSVMPKWKPGFQNGKAAEVSYNLPIMFMLK